MPSHEAAGTLVATLGIQFQLAASLLCLALGLLLGRGTGNRPWITWWAWSFGAVSLALGALLLRYTFLPVLPLDELTDEQARPVALLYAVYAGGKLLYLFCLLAGTWLFVRREPLPRIGVGAGLAFIAGVGLLFMLAPSDLNPLVAWQAGIIVPVFLICGGLLAGLPRERRTRGSRLLSLVCFLVASLWLLYTPAFLEAGPANVPGKLIFLSWLAGHNSYFDLIFEFLLGFGMILAVLDDVFHEAEEARTSRLRDVAASEARLSQIIRAASEGILLLDAQRRIVHSNPAALETLGASERDLTGESFDRFMTTSGTEDLWTAFERAASTPGGGYELCGRRADGTEFPLEISMRAIGSGVLEGYVLILRDRTQRVRAEQERERLQSQVAQTARLETIGRMVSGVAHELNNPLTAILAFGQDLLGQARNASDSEALNTIVQQSQRCRMIVQDLLTFARSKRDDRQPVDPGEIIHQVLPALQRQADTLGVRLVVSVADRLPSFDANPAAMEQVLTNLTVNALQAAGNDGTVTVSARIQDDRIAFIIEDDGPGLTEDVLPQLFEPFFTTKATGKGTGLGLSVSHALVEQHGGTLNAENRPGPGPRGARFTALLPFVDRRAVSRTPVAELPRGDVGHRPPGSAGAARRVLVIDDEAPIRIAIRRYLERRGWEVEEAKDGAEALALLGLGGDPPRSRSWSYDAIITDLKMPGLTGIELHDRLAAVDPEGLEKLVLITGDTASSDVADFVARLRQPLVQKPFDMRALADLLDRTAPAA